MLRRRVRLGANSRRSLIPTSWSSSTRPAPRPKWRGFTAARNAVNVAALRVPHGHWLTTTFTAALRRTALTAPMTLDGPMNAAAFRAYVEQVLAPTLNPGDIVVMDNLPAHKGAAVRNLIEAGGATLLLLPPLFARFQPESRMPMPSSNPACAKQPPGPSRPSRTQSPTPSKHSRQTNALTTSGPQDTGST